MVGKPQCARTYETSAWVIFDDVVQLKDMSKLSFKSWRNRLHLLMGEVAKSHWKGTYNLMVVAKGEMSRLLACLGCRHLIKKLSNL